MSELKIFQVTESECWAGYDAKSCQQAFLTAVGDGGEELLEEFGDPMEVDPEQLVVTEVDEPGQPKISGTEILGKIIAENIPVPHFVSTSEY